MIKISTATRINTCYYITGYFHNSDKMIQFYEVLLCEKGLAKVLIPKNAKIPEEVKIHIEKERVRILMNHYPEMDHYFLKEILKLLEDGKR